MIHAHAATQMLALSVDRIGVRTAADINSVEALFVAETVQEVNALRTNTAAYNAIYHATGTRICELPMRFEQLSTLA